MRSHHLDMSSTDRRRSLTATTHQWGALYTKTANVTSASRLPGTFGVASKRRHDRLGRSIPPSRRMSADQRRRERNDRLASAASVPGPLMDNTGKEQRRGGQGAELSDDMQKMDLRRRRGEGARRRE